MTFVSVIVPTYHDWERLQLCLDALERQTYPKRKFEIIVVNNDPNEKPPSGLVLPYNCHLLEESIPGSYAARNKGASAAVGDVLSFTDSDCIPQTNWIRQIAEYYANNNGILSGHVEMFSTLSNTKLNFPESYDYIFGINQSLYARHNTAATANLSITAREFFINNGFKSDMFSGGDIDFCHRARRKGIKFNYCEKVIVRHPLRCSIESLIVKARRVAGGKVYRNKFKALFFAIAPPLMRLNILLFKKDAPLYIKVKSVFVLLKLKLHQLMETIRLFFGATNERF